MKPYRTYNLKLVYYNDLISLLPSDNCISVAYQRSRNKELFASRPFFVYHDDIETDNIELALTLFHPNSMRMQCDTEPHVYPVILGDLRVDSAYFDGYVVGNVWANNLYSEYRMENINIGVGGDLSVEELFFVHRRKVVVAGNTSIHTYLARGQSEIESKSRKISHTFRFPIKNRADDFSLHSKDEVQAHFRNYAIDDVARIDRYYGVDVDAMLPIQNSAGKVDTKYLLLKK